ncbi:MULTISPECIES: hypothetical protein [Microbacterium]|uniref:hypothetical protein n=1 Tax=Microbacterium TaxID=33882 RepID=UPI001E64FA84|nr:hypothetical protein [Microbacterium nymphoidis]MCD2499782.1 hypothetical protein [Microbacterium nymphoidis]
MSSRRNRFFSDARFFIGIALVAASVAAVWGVVSAARTTVAVATAAGTLLPGQTLGPDDLQSTEVMLGTTSEHYILASEVPPGSVITRVVAPGELVPRDALAPEGSAQLTTVVIRSAVEVASGVRTGSTVDVWMDGSGESDAPTPRVLVSGAVVVSVRADDSMVRTASALIELVVPRDAVPDVLAAISSGSALSVISAGGGS